MTRCDGEIMVVLSALKLQLRLSSAFLEVQWKLHLVLNPDFLCLAER